MVGTFAYRVPSEVLCGRYSCQVKEVATMPNTPRIFFFINDRVLSKIIFSVSNEKNYFSVFFFQKCAEFKAILRCQANLTFLG